MTVLPNSGGTRWSGLETAGMKEARCSLLIQEEVSYNAKIKALPKQRVLVYQDKGFNPAATPSSGASTGSGNNNGNGNNGNGEDNFYVDFNGATILQLEPAVMNGIAHKTMPITMTLGGRCVFTPENYQDFRVMMRTKEQSQEMDIAPNGNFDWPDVSSLLLCPCCGNPGPVPREGDRKQHEYWMVFYPLLQITVMKGSQMTLGTRTVCRLTCLDCMEDLLEGLTLKVQPGGGGNGNGNNNSNPAAPPVPMRRPRLCFTLPASDVLAEAGSASFLEDGPARPDTHPHVDDILDAWTLYNLWEHSGAWEALQNDYRIVLSRSMHAESNAAAAEQQQQQNQQNNQDANSIASGGGASASASTAAASAATAEPKLKERIGKACGNAACGKVHGRTCSETGEMIRLAIKCRDCHSEFYCNKACREAAKMDHQSDCLQKQRDREERREKKAKKVQCDTCAKKFPYTKMKKCSRCRNATYCSVDCQRVDWEKHRFHCQERRKS